jgi:hypothetical protein
MKKKKSGRVNVYVYAFTFTCALELVNVLPNIVLTFAYALYVISFCSEISIHIQTHVNILFTQGRP